MLRVCVVSVGMPFEHGGAELRALRHVQYLREREETPALLIAWDQGEGHSSKRTCPSYIYPVRLRSREMGDMKGPVQYIRLLLHICEISLRLGWLLFRLRHQFDILHVIFAFSWFNLLAVAVAKALGKPVILEMTALGTDDPLTLNRRAGYPGKQFFPHQPLKYCLFQMADVYVSKSQPLSKAYHQAGLPLSKLFQIASAVDTQVFRPPADAQEREIIRRKLSLDAAETIILYTGRINEHKGLHWLVSAVRQLLPHYPGVKLLIVGPTTQSDQAYAQSLQEKVVQTGLSNSIRFVGRVANVYEYLQAADIFAIPTCREGFSGAILEAMSSKLPVVASDIPEIALSQIQNGTEGILVPVGDTEQLAQALETLIRNAELRSRLGNAARERVEREFTFQVIGSRYLRLYKSLLAERKFNEVSTEKDS